MIASIVHAHSRSPPRPDGREERWLIYYGEVHVGTIAIRSGIPHDKDPWGWRCGFYPESDRRVHVRHRCHLRPGAHRLRERYGRCFRRGGLSPTIRLGAMLLPVDWFEIDR